jgi:hypothetical protein
MARSAASGSGGASAGVKAVAAMTFVIVMALVVLLLVRARPAPEPFDPRSGQPSGARGLVLTLQAAGADVVDTRDVPFPEENSTVRVLVLEDRLDDAQRSDLLDFAEAGGVVVVADPDSTLHGGSGVDGGATPIEGDVSGAMSRRKPTSHRDDAPWRRSPACAACSCPTACCSRSAPTSRSASPVPVPRS